MPDPEYQPAVPHETPDAGESTPAPVPWFLYMIECRDGSLYTGIAIDVEARYAAHVGGKGARYTRSHPPLRLLAVRRYPDRSSALKAEYRIKQLKTAAKRRFAAELAHAPIEDVGKRGQGDPSRDD